MEESDFDEVSSEEENEFTGCLEGGTITRVEMQNFMCHLNFVLEFQKHVTVITGQNGSGKSTILLAIQLCLGMTSAQTQRGKSITDFINENHKDRPAIVKITLNNRCLMPYEKDKYGDSISIERIITPTGCSRYNIYTNNGTRVIFRKKDGMSSADARYHIVNHFNIQISNPICVMTQELCKQFIGETDPKLKYKVFMEATMLSILHENYDQSQRNAILMEQKLEQGENAISRLQDEYLNCLQEYTNAQTLRDHNIEKNKLLCKVLWSTICSNEAKCDHNFEQSEKRREHIDQVKESMRQAELQRDEAGEKRNEADEKVKINQSVIDELKENIQRIKEELNELKQPQQYHAQTIKHHQKNIQIQRRQIQHISDDMDNRWHEYEEESKKKPGGNLPMLEKRRTKLDNRLEELEQLIPDKEKMCNQQKGRMMELKNTHDNESKVARNAENNLKGAQQELRQIGSNHDKASLYHQNMRKLLNAMQQNAHLFKEMPVGPIGMHCSLYPDYKEWGPAVESKIGRSLQNFIVRSHGDSQTLRKMAQRFKINASIVTHQARDVYNLRRPHEDILTMENIIHFDEGYEWLVSVLADLTQFHTVGLFESVEQAEECFDKKGNGMLYGVRNCLLQSGDTTIRSNGYNNYEFAMKLGGVRFLHAKVEDRTEDLKYEIQELREVLKEVKQKAQRAQSDYMQSQKQYQQIERELKKMNTEHKKCSDAMDRIADDIERAQEEIRMSEEQPLEEPDMTELEEKKEDCLQQIADEEQKIETIKQEIRDCEAPMKEKQKEMTKITHNINSEQKKLHALMRNAKEYETAHRDAENALNRYERDIESNEFKLEAEREAIAKFVKGMYGRIEDSLERIETWRNEVFNLEADVARVRKKMGEAWKPAEGELESMGPKNWPSHPKITEPPASIEKKIEKLDVLIKRQAEEFGTKDVAYLKRSVDTSKFRLDDVKGTQESVSNLHNTLEENVELGHKHWSELVKEIHVKCNEEFMKTLGLLNYRGEIVIDRNREEFKILGKKGTNDEESLEDVRNLSGGERSYFNTALLACMTAVCESPFRIFDEADVAMDMQRRQAMYLWLCQLIPKAYPERQFVLITPLAVNAEMVGEDAEIIMLEKNLRF
eukprot:TRINITY_DN9193_c0_g1_i1.p1 TRINITY_DN9193_c0_g1~~TRINITY_DN9193_c0_g1_i1.p1  ORF type:complete len:1120 (+),score=383.80 TRINITY_DN9193_c0_g1_i1:74-3433(+)